MSFNDDIVSLAVLLFNTKAYLISIIVSLLVGFLSFLLAAVVSKWFLLLVFLAFLFNVVIGWLLYEEVKVFGGGV